MSQQTRSERIVMRVEPTVWQALTRFTGAQNISMSDYLRALTVKDLKDRGLLTDSMLAELTCG